MSIVDKAKVAFNQGIGFNVDASIIPSDSPLPKDKDGNTNCINYVGWAGNIDLTLIKYPRIDWIYKNYKEVNPAVGSLMCYPSQTIVNFEPGCIAIVSQITEDGQLAAIIIAHPDVKGILAEVTVEEMAKLRLFTNKPFKFVEIP